MGEGCFLYSSLPRTINLRSLCKEIMHHDLYHLRRGKGETSCFNNVNEKTGQRVTSYFESLIVIAKPLKLGWERCDLWEDTLFQVSEVIMRYSSSQWYLDSSWQVQYNFAVIQKDQKLFQMKTTG